MISCRKDLVHFEYKPVMKPFPKNITIDFDVEPSDRRFVLARFNIDPIYISSLSASEWLKRSIEKEFKNAGILTDNNAEQKVLIEINQLFAEPVIESNGSKRKAYVVFDFDVVFTGGINKRYRFFKINKIELEFFGRDFMNNSLDYNYVIMKSSNDSLSELITNIYREVANAKNN